MNAKKSADYCNLIENVKNKYRKNPICAKNLTLGWCDLRQGEDLCQEINLWTYWQGRNYARKTPHIKYMLIGQDFGPPEKEELKGTIANVRKMNDGIDVMFHDKVNLKANGGLENMVNWDGKDKDLLALIKYIADEDKLEKVLENPQVIKTPVVRNGKQSTLGYQPDIWKGWN